MVLYYPSDLFSGAQFQNKTLLFFTETVHSKIENKEFVSAALLELSKANQKLFQKQTRSCSHLVSKERSPIDTGNYLTATTAYVD